jgi:DNA polymerase-1
MPDVPKLLLIDGNNTCHKVFWAMKSSKQNLSYSGRAVEVVYGFFKQLISLHKDYPDYFRIVAWDRGYARRLAESEEAVKAGIIPSSYKATRHENDDAEKEEQLENLRVQMDEIYEGLKLVKGLQVAIAGVEADDIINTYVQTYRKWNGQFVVVSSDKDFYQLLGNGVIIRRNESDIWNEERFRTESGFAPDLWLEVGALMGEKGDNIHGAEGWGPVTACKYVQQYGNLEAVLAAIQAKEKKSKKEQVLLDSIPKVRLARSLKAMDVIAGLPKPKCMPMDAKVLEQYFLQWGFASLLKEVWRLV